MVDFYVQKRSVFVGIAPARSPHPRRAYGSQHRVGVREKRPLACKVMNHRRAVVSEIMRLMAGKLIGLNLSLDGVEHFAVRVQEAPERIIPKLVNMASA